MLSKFTRTVITAGTALAIATEGAIAQLTSAPRATGPSGNQVFGDFAAWFENHQGAGIALIAVVVLTIGYIAYGFLKPKAEAEKK